MTNTGEVVYLPQHGTPHGTPDAAPPEDPFVKIDRTEQNRLRRRLKERLEEQGFRVRLIDLEPVVAQNNALIGSTVGMVVNDYPIPPRLMWIRDRHYSGNSHVPCVEVERHRFIKLKRAVTYYQHETGEYAYQKINEHINKYVRTAEIHTEHRIHREHEEQRRAEWHAKTVAMIDVAATEYEKPRVQITDEIKHKAVSICKLIRSDPNAMTVLWLVREVLSREHPAGSYGDFYRRDE